MTTPLESQREVILCLLAGKSINRAANETGVPKGTISRLCKKQSFIDLMEQIKAENSKPKSQPKSAAKPVERAAVSVAVEVVDGPAYRGPGKPSKMTEATKSALFETIRKGGSERDACAIAMISYRTFIHWIQVAEGRFPERQPTEEYLLFLREYEIAMAQRNAMLVGLIRKAAVESTVEKYDGDGKLTAREKKSGDYRAALVLLERSTAREKADVMAAAREMCSESLQQIYAAIAATDRIPEQWKPVFYEVVAGVSGDGPGELAEQP
jgi:hypothetical protein